jgi:hypothetical protein
LAAPSRFEQAVASTPSLARSYRRGLQALRPADRTHVSASQPRLLTGSVHVDDALKRQFPNDARWDYAIGQRPRTGAEEILWIEIHPASGERHLGEMNTKFDWLLAWLRSAAPAMNYCPRRIIWIASGGICFTAHDQRLRQLRDRGLEFVGGHLRL